MVNDVSYEDLRVKESNIRESLLNKYNSLNTYEEKLIFLYNVILKSQRYYYEYTKNELCNEDALDKLINKLRSTIINNESDFIDFINDNLIIPSNSGHLNLSPIKIVGQLNSTSSNKKNISYQVLNNTLILSVTSFSRKYLNEAEAVFSEIKSVLETNNVDNIIIDIRGNNGGTDEFFKYFSIFFNQDITFEEHYKDLFTDTEYHYKNTVITKGTDKSYSRYILTDENVFSTADTFARICKSGHFATLVGSKTRGEGYGSSIISLPILENNYSGRLLNGQNVNVNGINLNFPIDVPLNENGLIDFDNLYSTYPDIAALGKDALAVVLDLIEINRTKNY